MFITAKPVRYGYHVDKRCSDASGVEGAVIILCIYGDKNRTFGIVFAVATGKGIL